MSFLLSVPNYYPEHDYSLDALSSHSDYYHWLRDPLADLITLRAAARRHQISGVALPAADAIDRVLWGLDNVISSFLAHNEQSLFHDPWIIRVCALATSLMDYCYPAAIDRPVSWQSWALHFNNPNLSRLFLPDHVELPQTCAIPSQPVLPFAFIWPDLVLKEDAPLRAHIVRRQTKAITLDPVKEEFMDSDIPLDFEYQARHPSITPTERSFDSVQSHSGGHITPTAPTTPEAGVNMFITPFGSGDTHVPVVHTFLEASDHNMSGDHHYEDFVFSHSQRPSPVVATSVLSVITDEFGVDKALHCHRAQLFDYWRFYSSEDPDQTSFTVIAYRGNLSVAQLLEATDVPTCQTMRHVREHSFTPLTITDEDCRRFLDATPVSFAWWHTTDPIPSVTNSALTTLKVNLSQEQVRRSRTHARSHSASAQSVKRLASASPGRGPRTRSSKAKRDADAAPAMNPLTNKKQASKRSRKAKETVPDPGSPRFSFREGQVPPRSNSVQGKVDQGKVLRQANTSLWLARATADEDPSRFLIPSAPLSSIFPSAASGMTLPTTSVLAHPISSAGGVPFVFEPRRPASSVVVNDRSQPLETYPRGSQAETGSDEESRKRRTSVPLAHIPTVVLQNDTEQKAKFPNVIRESDHERLEFPITLPACFSCTGRASARNEPVSCTYLGQGKSCVECHTRKLDQCSHLHPPSVMATLVASTIQAYSHMDFDTIRGHLATIFEMEALALLHHSFTQKFLRLRDHARILYHHLVKRADDDAPPAYLRLAYENDAAIFLALTAPESGLHGVDTSNTLPSLPELLRNSLEQTGPLISNEVLYATQLAQNYNQSTVHYPAGGSGSGAALEETEDIDGQEESGAFAGTANVGSNYMHTD